MTSDILLLPSLEENDAARLHLPPLVFRPSAGQMDWRNCTPTFALSSGCTAVDSSDDDDEKRRFKHRIKHNSSEDPCFSTRPVSGLTSPFLFCLFRTKDGTPDLSNEAHHLSQVFQAVLSRNNTQRFSGRFHPWMCASAIERGRLLFRFFGRCESYIPDGLRGL